jgi:hypothetical protein
MIIVTGADIKFEPMIQKWKRCINKFSYPYIIYDLGNLGFGKKGFEVKNINWQIHGHSNSLGGGIYKTTGAWLPPVILDALLSNKGQPIVYIDADARLLKPLILNWNSFDIAVAKRVTNSNHNPYAVWARGKHNAGVIFFNNNEKVIEFVKGWINKTNEVGNGQSALSILLYQSDLRVSVLPCIYNNTDIFTDDTIIHHQTGSGRNKK